MAGQRYRPSPERTVFGKNPPQLVPLCAHIRRRASCLFAFLGVSGAILLPVMLAKQIGYCQNRLLGLLNPISQFVEFFHSYVENFNNICQRSRRARSHRQRSGRPLPVQKERQLVEGPNRVKPNQT